MCTNLWGLELHFVRLIKINLNFENNRSLGFCVYKA